MFLLFNRPSVTRITLNNTLFSVFKILTPGKVLDVGSKNSPYLDKIPHLSYLRLDISSQSKPDIVCDLHKIKWKNSDFDTVIATEVLEHLYDPQKAVNEIFRVLKPGGVAILSTRFIYKYHPDPHDYFRYTKDSLEYLFKKFSKVNIYPHGNRIQVIWQLLSSSGLGFFLDFFNPLIAKINFRDEYFPLGFIVVAKK